MVSSHFDSYCSWQHPPKPLYRHLCSGAAGRPCLLQVFACWEPSAGPFCCTWRRARLCSQSFRSRLSALCFRELQGGPVCDRPLRVRCHLPAHSAALGDGYSSTHSASGRLSALWFRELQGGPICYRPFRFGCRLPAHSAALGDVYSSTHSAQELPATASLPKGLVSLAAIILANTQYSEVSAPMCLLVVANTPKACVSVESQPWLLLACSH